MFVTSNYKLGFIHIPRTGGTSVVTAFSAAENGYDAKQVCRTHAIYKEYIQSQPQQWFATIRHPGARLHSGYYYQLEQDRRRIMGMLPMKSDLTAEFLQKRIELFEIYGFEQTIVSHDFNEQYRWLKQQYQITSLNVLEQMQSICDYINGCKNILLFDIETQSQELFNWIKSTLPEINILHVNQKRHRINWKQEMTDKLTEYIVDKYKDDLEKFGYKL